MEIALGTVQFGLDYGISNTRGRIPENEVSEILRTAARAGVDILDTAHSYGESEEVIGRYLRETSHAFRVVSKLPLCAPAEVESFLRESLERLGINSLYGYLVHSAGACIEEPGIWDEVLRLKGEGLVERAGFSLYSPSEYELLTARGIEMDMVQVPLNIFDQRFIHLLPEMKERGMEVHARSAFLQGLLLIEPESLKGGLEQVRDRVSELRTIAREAHVSLSALCINFDLLADGVDRVILGVESHDNLRENLDYESYTEAVRDIRDRLLGLRVEDEDIILPVNWKDKGVSVNGNN